MEISQKKKNVIYLIASIVICLSSFISCKSAREIPKPNGEICINDAPRLMAYCSDIKSKEPLPDRQYQSTDAWIMMPVSTLNNISKYIDQLLDSQKADKVKIRKSDIYNLRDDAASMVIELRDRHASNK